MKLDGHVLTGVLVFLPEVDDLHTVTGAVRLLDNWELKVPVNKVVERHHKTEHDGDVNEDVFHLKQTSLMIHSMRNEDDLELSRLDP